MIFLYKFKEWILGAVAAIAAVAYIYAQGKKNASQEAQEAILDDVKDRQEIRDRVDRMSDERVRDELLNNWSRKE